MPFAAIFCGARATHGVWCLCGFPATAWCRKFFDNDLVLLDRGQTEISPGRLYAVGFEDAIYIKRIDKLPGKIVLHSVNPAYPPVSLDLRGDCADQFRVIGRVLWSGREYR